MVEALKGVAMRIPGLRFVYRSLRSAYTAYRLRNTSTEEIFTDIYTHNRWGGTTSVSGPGSAIDQTAVIARALPVVFRELNVYSVLDIPCGDFQWMRTVNLDGIQYIGADIVLALVDRNKEAHGRTGIEFRHLNLVADRLPKVDLILCRDCLVHLCYADVFRALANICHSGSVYLLTTTFTSRVYNRDIATGDFHPLNVQRPPFTFPAPLRLINEQCTEGDGAYRDKSLGLWRIADLEHALPARRS
jgi:hypothetical protein